MVAEYELLSHTSIPQQQEDGSIVHTDYYSPDEVNFSLKGMLNKILNK